MLFLAVSCASATDPKPVGNMIDVGGRRLHLYCTGAGAPTIVLEASGGTGWYMWHAIQAELSREFRVCSYDRAGTAFSDARPNYGKSVEVTLQDLHEVLRRGGEKPPFVMAGHSIGGFYVWKYAERFPGDVRGLVLLDSMIPGPPRPPSPEAEAARAKAWKQIEEWRKNGKWEAMYVPAALPPAWKDAVRRLSMTEKWWVTRFTPLGPDTQEPFRPLTVPITVVTATQRKDLARIDELFASMSNVKHIKIDERHDFHEDEPQLVIDVIREMARSVRE